MIARATRRKHIGNIVLSATTYRIYVVYLHIFIVKQASTICTMSMTFLGHLFSHRFGNSFPFRLICHCQSSLYGSGSGLHAVTPSQFKCHEPYIQYPARTNVVPLRVLHDTRTVVSSSGNLSLTGIQPFSFWSCSRSASSCSIIS